MAYQPTADTCLKDDPGDMWSARWVSSSCCLSRLGLPIQALIIQNGFTGCVEFWRFGLGLWGHLQSWELEYWGLIDTILSCSFWPIKQEIHVIIQSKHFCLLDFSKNLKIKIYKTIILPVVLYGCEARSLTLRDHFGWLGRMLECQESNPRRDAGAHFHTHECADEPSPHRSSPDTLGSRDMTAQSSSSCCYLFL